MELPSSVSTCTLQDRSSSELTAYGPLDYLFLVTFIQPHLKRFQILSNIIYSVKLNIFPDANWVSCMKKNEVESSLHCFFGLFSFCKAKVETSCTAYFQSYERTGWDRNQSERLNYIYKKYHWLSCIYPFMVRIFLQVLPVYSDLRFSHRQITIVHQKLTLIPEISILQLIVLLFKLVLNWGFNCSMSAPKATIFISFEIQ